MKTLYKIGMLAVAALAFAGCSKEVDNFAEQSTGTHTLTFTVQKDVDTRTAVVEGEGVASYVWTEGDKQYFHIYENGVEATATTMVLSADKKIATFKATFKNTDATEFSYRATYGSDLASSKPHNPLIPANQLPGLDSFDPAADVLVSAEDIVLDGKADENIEFLFKLKRVVSVNKMTLKGLTAGEKISTVELASDMSFSARYGIESGNYTSNAKKIVLDYSDLDAAVVGTDGNFPVYFVSAPVEEATFSVRVVTDKAVYTRDDFKSKLTLSVGTFFRFGVSLEGYGESISQGTKYTLVEDDLFDGATYILVGGDLYALGLQKENNRSAVAVTDADGIITIDNSIDAYPILIESTTGGYTMKDVRNNKYLYTNSTSANRLQSRDEVGTDNFAVWTISISDGVASISNVGNTSRGILCFNPNNGSPMFASYGSAPNGGTAALALYVDKTTCVELADPELSFDVDLIEVNWDEIESFTAPALNNPHGLAISYSSSEPTVATVDATSGKIAFVGNGETTITAKSTRTDVYRSGEASYVLTVTGKVDFESIAELNAKATGTATMWDGHLENAIVSFVPDSKNAIIKDATGSVLVYINTDDGHGLKQGQTFTGYFTPTIKLYNGTAEITDLDEAVFNGEETVVEPESLTLADLVGNLAKYQNAYVKVTDLFVTSVSGRNLSVMNGDNTYVVFVPNNCPIVAGDFITVTGTVAHYGDNDQIKVWSLDDIVKTGHELATPSIFFTQPSQGGSFTVEVDGSQITSGTAVKEGKTVTLTATVADGYTFNGWTVSGATVSGNTTSETFVVGTSDITISASIKSSSITYVVDVLNQSLTGITSTSYSDWSGKESNSEAVYAGNSAGGNASIQLRSNNNNSGVITTKSGGKVTKITVTWNSNTASGRTLNIYGSNSAYTAASDLYNSSTQGTLLGTIVYGTSTELEIDGDYAYIGFRSNSGAMYLSEVEVTWSK